MIMTLKESLGIGNGKTLQIECIADNQRSVNLENRKTKTKEKRNKIPRKSENKKINLEIFVVAEKTCRVRGAPPLR